MRVPLIVMSLLLAAGCSGDHARIAGDHARSTASTTPMAATSATLARRATSPAGFASLPDRGELMAYVPGQQAVRRSAYTWHPVRLSEAHALNAIVGGELVVRAPDGRPIRLRYERHVEHADGNWTWIGREEGAVPGSEAILTFGEKAVFGSIPNGTGLPYRLTSAAGRSWLVETDRNRLARTVNAATRPEAPDFLLPPRIEGLAPRPAAGAGTQGEFSTGAAPAVGALTASGTTIDLLLGYTAAFASRLGGQSEAMTRLNYLVDVTNVAYANSQIDAQVNLVRAVQVNYADATSNEDALYDLTGVECTEQAGGGLSCQYVGPATALQPLHAARDQYGADLVSLVRNFNDSENDGCGLAWINGGGQLPITVDDEITGLSVVSDSNGTGGPDAFPDNGYICRDETLAHELGHNMGSAHDRDTSDGDDNVLQSNEYGRYPYSFGYKSSGGNFFTVMAYGDSGLFPYRVFSNPAITYCGGSPCGVANTADNARSLRQTMPIVAEFRATATVFADVPAGFWARNHIETLYGLGVTGGCGTNPLRYCPSLAVTRDSMVVFLLRAKHGASYQPPAASGVFADVPVSYWAAAWIERARTEGITGGCATNPLRFCPTTTVNREQMAVFLLRAKYGAAYQPPSPTGMFADVPVSHWAAAWIEQLAREGVTGGCSTSPLKFCPGAVVTRDQMAVFLVRNFDF